LDEFGVGIRNLYDCNVLSWSLVSNNKVILRQSYQVELNVSRICFRNPLTPNYILYGVISDVML